MSATSGCPAAGYGLPGTSRGRARKPALAWCFSISIWFEHQTALENLIEAPIRVYHQPPEQARDLGLRLLARPHVRLRTGRPVSQYAGNEGCAGLAGAEPHA